MTKQRVSASTENAFGFSGGGFSGSTTFMLTLLLSAFVVLLAMTGCSTVDNDKAISVISEGLEERWEFADNPVGDAKEATSRAIQIELDACTPLQREKAIDSDLRDFIKSYVECLNEQKTIGYSSFSDWEKRDKWDSVYQQRAKIISIFVNQYGLTVSEEHQKELDEILVVAELGETPDSMDVESVFMGGLVFDLPSVWKVESVTDNFAKCSVSPYSQNASLNLTYVSFDGTQTQEYTDARVTEAMGSMTKGLSSSDSKIKNDIKNELKDVNGFTVQDETLNYTYANRKFIAREIACSDGSGVLMFLLVSPASRYDDYAISMSLAVESIRREGEEPSREYKEDQKAVSGKTTDSPSPELDDSKTETIDEKVQGWLVSTFQKEVSSNLKSPKSAKYPWSFKEYEFAKMSGSSHLGYDRYQIDGYVDADNSYGTSIRTYCRVVVDMKKTDGSYYLIECSKLA